MIGRLGSFEFVANNKQVLTINEMSTERSANYGQHQVYHSFPKTEFINFSNDTISLSIKLSAYEGVKVNKKLEELKDIFHLRNSFPFTIGGYFKGMYVITSMSENVVYFGPDGKPSVVDVSLSLTGVYG